MDFWKSFGASLLAWVVGLGGLFFLMIASIVGIVASMKPAVEPVKEDTILCIDLAENINDAPSASVIGTLNSSNMAFETPITIMQALAATELAAEDDDIEGICIMIDGAGTVSAANIEELRAAIERFKLSGKFVVAYDDNYTQGEYYLASAADQIYLNPEGSLSWTGIGMASTFYKGLLDKLDAEVEVFRPTGCRYKSGVEPFIRTDMSPADRKQSESLVNSMWQSICEDVSQSRGIEVDLLKRYARECAVTLPEDALNAKLIDGILYEDELYALYDSFGVERNSLGLHNIVSLGEYIEKEGNAPLRVSVGNEAQIEYTENNLVAIIYAEGQIVDGDMYMDGEVYGTRLARELRQARLNDDTKAVVVRVNSPGGSALASEVAWREMQLLQEVKPVVVSMGSLAASGGYYISAPADYILADELTLTGSIGVFGMIPNFEKTLKNKLGITFDAAATSPEADGLTGLRPLTAKERASIMRSIDRIYDTFTSHVAEGRNLAIERVLEIAEGRVWSGTEAVECGLVDAIGGFNDAIAKALELADIKDDYALYEFTAPLTPFEEWLNGMGMVYATAWGVDYNIHAEDVRDIVKENSFIIKHSGIQTLLSGDMRVEF